MKAAELKKLFKAGEWNDVEFKEARSSVSKSAFETVSAFSNAHGGWLVFGDDSRLFEPGEKEARNPAIAMAMCEQAGTGMRMMRDEWQKLGHPTPTYKNDRAWKAFEFFIPELDKEVDMASDLIKAMFGHTDRAGAPDEAQVTGEVTPEVTPEVTGEVASEVVGFDTRDVFDEKGTKSKSCANAERIRH